ncbi:MAG: flagellar hook-length control protein FliK [Lachnospiraceae bacterium]|nr:flagellar hook-length control protein FliK [Lachnospiraceae bacterium]
MQISDILSQLNRQTLANATGNKTIASENGTISGKGIETLLGLKEGAVFEGTVTSLDGGKATISLANGSVISARMEEGVTLDKGGAAFFQVKSNVDGQIALKTVSQNNMSNPTLLKALQGAGVAINERNLDLVNSMMKQQLPIDSKHVLSMVRAASVFKGADVSTLTTLEKMQLPINDENIEQIQHYIKGEGEVKTNLEVMSNELPKLLETAKNPEEALKLNQKLLEVFLPNEEETQVAGIKENAPQMTEKNATASSFGQPVENTKDETVVTSKPSPESNSAGESAGETVSKEAVVGETKENFVTTQSFEEQPFTAKEPVAEKESVPLKEEMPKEALLQTGGKEVVATPEKPELFTEVKPLKEAAPENDKVLVQAQEQVQEQEQSGQKSTPLDSAFKNILSSEKEPLVQWQKLTQLLDKAQFPKEDIKSLFQSTPFKNMVEKAVQSSWFLQPEEVEEKEKVKELYQKMDRQLMKLQSVLADSGKETGSLAKQVTDTRANLNFMNQVHQMYNYVQIPLKMANQNATGELYVYTNKKSMHMKNGEITAHLHLEMDHLGTTDVFVKLVQKKLTTNFRMENEESLDLVMSHIDILTKRLSDKGFDVAVDGSLMDRQPENFVAEILGEENNQETKVSRYSFDVKV